MSDLTPEVAPAQMGGGEGQTFKCVTVRGYATSLDRNTNNQAASVVHAVVFDSRTFLEMSGTTFPDHVFLGYSTEQGSLLKHDDAFRYLGGRIKETGHGQVQYLDEQGRLIEEE